MPERITGEEFSAPPRLPSGHDAGRANAAAISENRKEALALGERIRSLEQGLEDNGTIISQHEEQIQKLYHQSEPCTSWGRGVERRLRALEEGNAGLEDEGPMPAGELVDMAMHHINEADHWLRRYDAMQDNPGWDPQKAENLLRRVRAHADTARAQLALARAVSL